jgi:arylsulfatase A-like enzyme
MTPRGVGWTLPPPPPPQKAYDFNDDIAPSTLRPATEFYNDYSAMVFTTRAVKIISSFSAASAHPLFLYLPYQNVHWPLEAPDEYVARFTNTTGGDKARNMVCAMIAVLDSGVGNVTAALKSAGIYDNTFIIFSSDNGGPTHGDEGTSSNNFPLRGGKNTIWEGGTRVVGAIAGPGIPKTGATLFEKMHATDWLPTLVTMAAGKSWTNFVAKDEPEYQFGDGKTFFCTKNSWIVLHCVPFARGPNSNATHH